MANYYYGEELLPQIPQDVISNNPYYWIKKGSSSYSVMLAPHPWYVSSGSMYTAESCTNYVYKLPIGGTEWTLSNTYNDTGGFSLMGQMVVFTSHDIPSGSPTASSIWLYGSEPVPEEPEEPDTPTTYTITFKNWDGSVISTTTYNAGATLVVPPNPTKPDDGNYTYTFKEWTPALVTTVNADAIYTAVFTAIRTTYMSVSDIFTDISNATAIRNGTKNDDDTDTVTGVNWFNYGGNVCSSVYVSGNSWLGFGTSGEHLKVNRRDGESWFVYREEGTLYNHYKFLRIRFSGYSKYNQTLTSYKITYDVILWDTGDISLHLIDIPTNKYDGTFVLGNLSYTKPTIQNPNVTFKLQSDGTYEVSYSVIELILPFDKKYLVRANNTLYTVADGVLSALGVTNVSADVFRQYGVDKMPSGDLLKTFRNFELLFWQDSTEYELPTFTALVTATPTPQNVISQKINLIHETISGIEKMTAICEGELICAVSFDNKTTWKMYNGGWQNAGEFSGMNKATLEAITTEQWALLFNGADSLYIRVTLNDLSQSFTKIDIKFTD